VKVKLAGALVSALVLIIVTIWFPHPAHGGDYEFFAIEGAARRVHGEWKMLDAGHYHTGIDHLTCDTDGRLSIWYSHEGALVPNLSIDMDETTTGDGITAGWSGRKARAVVSFYRRSVKLSCRSSIFDKSSANIWIYGRGTL
jgi:hypothetical protein